METKFSSEQMENYILKNDPPAYGPSARLGMKIDLPVLLDGSLSPLDKVILFTIYSLEDVGCCHISNEDLAWMANVNENEVVETLQNLTQRGRIGIGYSDSGSRQIEVIDSAPEFSFLRIADAVRYLNISEESLHRLIAEGYIDYDEENDCFCEMDLYVWKRFNMLYKERNSQGNLTGSC